MSLVLYTEVIFLAKDMNSHYTELHTHFATKFYV